MAAVKRKCPLFGLPPFSLSLFSCALSSFYHFLVTCQELQDQVRGSPVQIYFHTAKIIKTAELGKALMFTQKA